MVQKTIVSRYEQEKSKSKSKSLYRLKNWSEYDASLKIARKYNFLADPRGSSGVA